MSSKAILLNRSHLLRTAFRCKNSCFLTNPFILLIYTSKYYINTQNACAECDRCTVSIFKVRFFTQKMVVNWSCSGTYIDSSCNCFCRTTATAALQVVACSARRNNNSKHHQASSRFFFWRGVRKKKKNCSCHRTPPSFTNTLARVCFVCFVYFVVCFMLTPCGMSYVVCRRQNRNGGWMGRWECSPSMGTTRLTSWASFRVRNTPGTACLSVPARTCSSTAKRWLTLKSRTMILLLYCYFMNCYDILSVDRTRRYHRRSGFWLAAPHSTFQRGIIQYNSINSTVHVFCILYQYTFVFILKKYVGKTKQKVESEKWKGADWGKCCCTDASKPCATVFLRTEHNLGFPVKPYFYDIAWSMVFLGL